MKLYRFAYQAIANENSMNGTQPGNRSSKKSISDAAARCSTSRTAVRNPKMSSRNETAASTPAKPSVATKPGRPTKQPAAAPATIASPPVRGTGYS